LGVASRNFNTNPKKLNPADLFKDLSLIALIAIKDPLREGVTDAIDTCQHAGVKVRMVTGDNIVTACSIAMECGLLRSTFNLEE
jgi:Ca2+-transporting ATPase